jgi:hypothetical protein
MDTKADNAFHRRAGESKRADAALALFLKFPEPGTVKSRISAVLGPDRAARFYWECALLVMAKSLRLKDCDHFVFYTPPDRGGEMEELVLARFGKFEGRFVPQADGDLGWRIHAALEHLGSAGYARKLVLGIVSPSLPLDYLKRAVDALGEKDCVIGPTWDGGFYLTGVRRPDARILKGIPWGTGMELSKIYDNLTALGMTSLILPRWQDVDSAEDLEFIRGHVRSADLRRLKEILEEGPAGPA